MQTYKAPSYYNKLIVKKLSQALRTHLVTNLLQNVSRFNVLYKSICFSADIESIQSSYGSSVIERMLNKPRRSLEDILPTAPVDGLDLLRRLLQFNPEKRPTAEEVLHHPYVSRFHNSDDEPTIDHEVHPPLSDDQQLSVDEYRKKLYEVCAAVWVNSS